MRPPPTTSFKTWYRPNLFYVFKPEPHLIKTEQQPKTYKIFRQYLNGSSSRAGTEINFSHRSNVQKSNLRRLQLEKLVSLFISQKPELVKLLWKFSCIMQNHWIVFVTLSTAINERMSKGSRSGLLFPGFFPRARFYEKTGKPGLGKGFVDSFPFHQDKTMLNL